MALVKRKHLNLYKKYTEQLIEDLGQIVSLEMRGDIERCNNCRYDLIHKCSSGIYNGSGPKPFSGGVCPVCNGEGNISSVVYKNIKCSVNWVPFGSEENMVEITSAGKIKIGYYMIKSKVINRKDIESAEKIIIDGVKTRLVNIISRGLKENVVVEAYTEIDES